MRLRRREFSATELAEAHLAAIEKARALNAFVLETPDRAREMARLAIRAREGEGGPLAGCRSTYKDVFCTADVRTTACSRVLDNFVPAYKSTVPQASGATARCCSARPTTTSLQWARRTRRRTSDR